MVVNTSFGGLKSDEALKLSSFFHLRPVDKLRKHTKFALSELDKTIEFLDPLNEDFPSGCWSLVSEPLTSQARARSRLLPAALLCSKACRGGVSTCGSVDVCPALSLSLCVGSAPRDWPSDVVCCMELLGLAAGDAPLADLAGLLRVPRLRVTELRRAIHGLRQ